MHTWSDLLLHLACSFISYFFPMSKEKQNISFQLENKGKKKDTFQMKWHEQTWIDCHVKWLLLLVGEFIFPI